MLKWAIYIAWSDMSKLSSHIGFPTRLGSHHLILFLSKSFIPKTTSTSVKSPPVASKFFSIIFLVYKM